MPFRIVHLLYRVGDFADKTPSPPAAPTNRATRVDPSHTRPGSGSRPRQQPQHPSPEDDELVLELRNEVDRYRVGVDRLEEELERFRNSYPLEHRDMSS